MAEANDTRGIKLCRPERHVRHIQRKRYDGNRYDGNRYNGTMAAVTMAKDTMATDTMATDTMDSTRSSLQNRNMQGRTAIETDHGRGWVRMKMGGGEWRWK